MKKLSTTALVIAAGMASSAQAVDFEVNDRTTLSVFGALELKYNTAEVYQNNQGDTESESEFADNGSVIGFAAEHRFDNGLTSYFLGEFEYDSLDGGSFDRDHAYGGLRGDFGDIRAGAFDSIYTEAVYDVIDPFETVSLGEGGEIDDDHQIAYFSPNFGGFSFELQARINGDAESSTGDNEHGFAGVLKYSAERWAVHAAMKDRGSMVVDPAAGTTKDPVYGLAGVVSVTDRVGLAARYQIQENVSGDTDSYNGDADVYGDETAFYGALVTFDYGMGDLYAGVQEVDPDTGDSETQFGLGANYAVVDNLYVYGEYGNLDRPEATGNIDSQYEVGAVYEF